MFLFHNLALFTTLDRFVVKSLKGLLLLLLLVISGAAVADNSAPVSQDELLDEYLDALKQNRPGITDLYFIGIAPYSTEDVFMNETIYVRKLFDQKYETSGRSLLLINNKKTSELYPAATVENMEQTFHKIGTMINPEEDMIVLFITSHGDKGKGIRLKSKGIDSINLSRKYLDAKIIRNFLDKNNIRWRVIILSACFSGGLVETLENEHSLIITSASSESPSFGCGHHGDFTQFGEAFFRRNLNSNPDFISAFESARMSISRLERELDISASNPQIHIGEKIRPLLDKIASIASESPE